MRRFLVVAGCAAVVSACGSSSHGDASTAKNDSALALSQCMRANGVPNFPDPGADGRVQIAPASGLKPDAPAFQAAQQACRRYLPKFPRQGVMSASQRRSAVAFADCMRAHGQSDFPDPTVGPPNPNATGRVLVVRGMFFALGPGLDPNSPAFRQAAGHCGLTILPG